MTPLKHFQTRWHVGLKHARVPSQTLHDNTALDVNSLLTCNTLVRSSVHVCIRDVNYTNDNVRVQYIQLLTAQLRRTLQADWPRAKYTTNINPAA